MKMCLSNLILVNHFIISMAEMMKINLYSHLQS